MNYDFSFEKRQMVLLIVLAVLMALLLVLAGFLMGRISIAPAAGATVVAVPTVPAVALPAAPARPALAAPSAAVPAPPDADGSDSLAPSPAPVDIAPVGSAAQSRGRSVETADPLDGYVLQYGAFRDAGNARDLLKELKDAKIPAAINVMSNSLGQNYSVVRSGAYPTLPQAREAASTQANTLRMPIVVRPAGRL